jgi:hypothetical protein
MTAKAWREAGQCFATTAQAGRHERPARRHQRRDERSQDVAEVDVEIFELGAVQLPLITPSMPTPAVQPTLVLLLP